MLTKKMKQKPTQIRISEYQEVFSTISVLSKNMSILICQKSIDFGTYMKTLK